MKIPWFKTLLIPLLFVIATDLYAENIDKMLADYKTASSGNYISMANDICRAMYKEELYDPLMTFAPHTDRSKVDAFVYYIAAEWYTTQNRFVDAVRAATEGARISRSINDIEDAANCYSTLCVAYQRLGNLEQALLYGKKCYETDVVTRNYADMSSALNNLATLCLYDHKVNEAREYIEKAINIERPLKRGEKLAIRLGVASEVYSALNLYDKAIACAKEAYEIDCRDGREGNSAKRLSQLAFAYYSKKDMDTARRYYLQAIPILKKYQITTSLAITYNQLGLLEKEVGHTSLSITYIKEAARYATQTKNMVQTEKAFETLSELLEDSSPREALNYLRQAFNLQQELFNEKSEKQIDNFNIKYHTAEQEAKIAQQQSAIYRHTTLRDVLIGGLIVCVIFLSIYICLNVKLRRRNEELYAANNVKNKFFSLISHDLKNPVIAQKQLLKVMVNDFDKMKPDDIHGMCNELLTSSESLNELLYNLLNWSRLETGRISVQPVDFPLYDVINISASYYATSLTEKSLSLNISMPRDAIAHGDLNMISIVVRNLIDNAIKFTYSNTCITIDAKESNGYWKVAVADEGMGMPDDVIRNLFKLSDQGSRPGTNGEKGTGLGLIVCKEMLEHNGGTITAERNGEKGSRFIFTVKKA
jgi:signal transduction histidine kinase